MRSGENATHNGLRKGGCAFCGAKMALQPIADAAHLIHGPMLCFGHNQLSRPTQSSGPTLYAIDFTTAISESEIVLGGERHLARALDDLVARHDPPAIFVHQTCVPALIGDDVAAVCRAAAKRLGRPVVPVLLSGLAGGKDHGTNQAGDILLDHVIGTREPDEITTTDVVLIGEYNVAGEVEQVRPLLNRLGIRLTATIPGDGRFAHIAGAHRARAAVALCSRSLGTLAEGLRERHGVPFIRGSFYGDVNVSDTLRRLAALLVARGGPADLPERTETLIAQEEARVEAGLAPFRAALIGRRALIGCGGVKSWSLAVLLRRIGLEVVGTTTTKCSPREHRRAAEAAGEDHVRAGLGRKDFDPATADIVLSGGLLRVAALRAGLAWVEVNHQRDLPLCGYDGTLRLAEAMAHVLANPLRAGGIALPPWERTKATIRAVV
jgi:nitrogenase molybdenum-cofactor synthesis protein NifE